MPGMVSVSEAMIWLMKDGTMWMNTVARLPRPASRAATMKSYSRSARNLPRTTRASVVHPSSERMTVMARQVCTTGHPIGNAALKPIHSGRLGIEMRISMPRLTTSSSVPPKNPATPPIRMPRKKLIATPTNPMESEICAPYRVRAPELRRRRSRTACIRNHVDADPRDSVDGLETLVFNAFMMAEADKTEVVTLWIPLLDATVENGCLQLIPYSHRDGLQQHCNPGVAIPDRLIRSDDAVPVPLQQGGVLFMHRLMEHAPLANRSDTIRWSFDLRYNPSNKPSGRDVQPGFVARSRSRPETEVRDYETWSALWYQTRARLAGQPDPVYERWGADEPGCA